MTRAAAMGVSHQRTELAAVSVRFGGDAGDGVMLAGEQLTRASASLGNAVFTLPDHPSEIRAPHGSLAGVAAFQVRFGAAADTPGDCVHTLVAMNAAALRANLPDVQPGGTVIVNTDVFMPDEWVKAGYERDPLADGTLAGFQVIRAPIDTLNREAVAGLRLSARESDRCKSFFALGLVFWLYDRPLEPTVEWLKDRFPAQPDVFRANKRALRAGHHFGLTVARSTETFRVIARALDAGIYRRVSGATAMTLGLAAAAARTGREVFCAGFPVVPAAELFHQVKELRPPGICAAQAEDEVGAASLAIGAAFGGAIGVVISGGPGLGLMSEILGLGVMAELPMVMIHIQQGGPGLGLPSRTEQADLLQALFGRNGECPLPVVAPASPADGFDTTLEAIRLATRYMTPVIVLADVYLMQAAEVWPVPDVASLPKLTVVAPGPTSVTADRPFLPYARDVRLSRPWALPGTPGLEHRIGPLEKEDGTGVVSFEPADHEHMVHVRAQKVSQIAGDVPRLSVAGPSSGEMLLISWGSTCAAVRDAAARLRETGLSVAHAHLRHLSPMPQNTGAVLRSFRRVVAVEMNAGQLRSMLRSQFAIDVEPLNKVQGRPFRSREIVEWVTNELGPRRLQPEAAS